MFFDSHAHYDDARFDSDRNHLLSAMQENNVSLILNAGADIPTSKAAYKLTQKYDFMYSAAGVHPHDTDSLSEDLLSEIEHLLYCKKVVAVGEIGLDYYYDNSPREIQKKWFYRQLELAQKHDMPVIIHDRDAHQDCMDMIRDFPDLKIVFHCFSGSPEMAKQLLSRGVLISFAGPVTFKNARKQQETAKIVPDDMFLIETDSPYLSPEPNRGKRNDSTNLKYIAQKLAELKNTTIEEIAALSMANAKRFFNIS